MKEFKNKQVLLLCPPFYGYEKEIVVKLEELGAEVKYVEDHPSERYITLVEVMHRLGVKRSWFVKHYENIVLSQIGKRKFDMVLIINGPYLTSRFTSILRKNHLKSKDSLMVLYFWDALVNLKEDTTRWKDFDKIFTFDNVDYEVHKDIMGFLPLFYCDRYWIQDQKPSEYDIMIIGSFRLSRYNFVKELEYRNPNVRIGYYLYHSKWGIFLHKTFRSKYNHVNYKDLRYKKLSFKEVVDLYNKSVAIVDIPENGQNGLTIRTIEALAMHKKLITTNERVKKYDFYNPEDIFVLSRESLILPEKEWYNKSYSVSDETIIKYNIGSWLLKLLYYAKK